LTRINVAALAAPRDQARIPWSVVFAMAYATRRGRVAAATQGQCQTALVTPVGTAAKRGQHCDHRVIDGGGPRHPGAGGYVNSPVLDELRALADASRGVHAGGAGVSAVKRHAKCAQPPSAQATFNVD
jgi:hypothetical protein